MCAVSSSFCEGFGSVEVFGGGDLRWGLLAHPPSSFPWKHIWCRQVFSPLETAVSDFLCGFFVQLSWLYGAPLVLCLIWFGGIEDCIILVLMATVQSWC